ncbi:MAG: hypothetical protein PSY14_06785 [bacterium]|nr:hypothetical protein [bacterium]
MTAETQTIRDIAEASQPIAAAAAAAPVADGNLNTAADAGAGKPIIVAKGDKQKKKNEKYQRAKRDESFFDIVDLPDDCPVEPLGLNGGVYYYINANRELTPIKANDHGRLVLQGLFGQHTEVMWRFWPAFNKEGTQTGWKPAGVAETLMRECAALGLIDIVDRVRGPGAWRDDDGNLVMHCGDIVYAGGEAAQTNEPGRLGRHIYPAAAEKPRPHPENSSKESADKLLALIKQWNWRRPDIDPILLLGWLGAAIVGGALRWRPIIWTTGDKATGKSTLHELTEYVMGPGGMIHATDPTAAGLWQAVGNATLPIDLDELESEEDNRKQQNIIKLARHAASGGKTLRGGSDHKGTSFTIRSCFRFSSILIPPLSPQDQSRIAILSLDTLPVASLAPRLEPKILTEIGAVFRRRMMEKWPELQDRLDKFKAALQAKGHSGRSSDQFGTLLACADLLLHDDVPDTDTLAGWGDRLEWATLAEAEDDISDSERCNSHMFSTIIDVFRDGKKRSIGSWIQQGRGDAGFSGHDAGEANRCLATFGLRVEVDKDDNKAWLLVANSHQGLASIFRDTKWAGSPGSSGVWVQSMRRVEGAEASKSSTNFGGAPSRYTRLPIDKILPVDKGGHKQ